MLRMRVILTPHSKFHLSSRMPVYCFIWVETWIGIL